MRPLIPSLLALALFVSCSSSSAPTIDSEPVDTVKTVVETSEPYHGTVKPGPNVQIRTELRETLLPGDSGALEITLLESYPTGRLTVKASTSDGLELFTTSDETRFNMSGTDEHNWTVFFDTEEAGRHYITLWVAVDTPFGRLTRSSAAIVQVGPESSNKTNTRDNLSIGPDGKPVIRMTAEETISISDN